MWLRTTVPPPTPIQSESWSLAYLVTSIKGRPSCADHAVFIQDLSDRLSACHDSVPNSRLSASFRSIGGIAACHLARRFPEVGCREDPPKAGAKSGAVAAKVQILITDRTLKLHLHAVPADVPAPYACGPIARTMSTLEGAAQCMPFVACLLQKAVL